MSKEICFDFMSYQHSRTKECSDLMPDPRKHEILIKNRSITHTEADSDDMIPDLQAQGRPFGVPPDQTVSVVMMQACPATKTQCAFTKPSASDMRTQTSVHTYRYKRTYIPSHVSMCLCSFVRAYNFDAAS